MTENAVRQLPTGATIQPASITQTRVINMRYARGSVATQTVGCHLLIEGSLDSERLSRAFTAIVQRHPILRTNYARAEDGTVLAIVHDAPGPGTFWVERTTGMTDEEDIRVHVSWVFSESLSGFTSPDRHSMLQARHIVHTPALHSLLITIDHIAIDERSKVLIQQDLALLYANDRAELAPAPAYDPTRVRSDHPQLQNLPELMRSLTPLPPRIFPSPDPVADPSAFDPVVESLALSPAEHARIGRAAKRLRCTRFVLHLAAWFAALKQFTQASDVSVVAAVDTRNRPEEFATVGFYQNLALLRSRSAVDADPQTILEECKEVVLDALEFRDYPIASLVAFAAEDTERSRFRNPLYQVAFAYATANVDDGWQIDGATVRTIPLESPEAGAELLISLTDSPTEVSVELLAAKGALDGADMAVLLGYWQKALHRLTEE